MAKSIDKVEDVVNALNLVIARIIKDESELKLQYDELQKQTARSEKLTAIGEMASRLTHNLRNPLTVIKASIKSIKMQHQTDLPEEIRENLERIEDAATNMSQQIQDVLLFVRDKPLDLENNNLSKILHSAIKNIEKPHTVNIHLPDDDVIIKCDSSKLQVVFMNLFTNAIHAMYDEGEIKVTLNLTENGLDIHVEDSGLKLRQEDLPKLFESFFTTKPFGTGLGLAYCKNTIEQHGGSISAKAHPTVFTIRLPKETVISHTEPSYQYNE